jgi:F-type H+-transporting ATPase subunit b
MNRHTFPSIAISISALALGLLVALPAQATGESLEVFPNIRGYTFYCLIAFFALLVFPVNKLLFHPIFRVLDERQARIEGARKRADAIGAEADALLDRYRSGVRSAREQAESGRRQVLEEARRAQARLTGDVRSEAEAEINRAREEVAGALADARSQLREQAEALAREAATRVLGRSLR